MKVKGIYVDGKQIQTIAVKFQPKDALKLALLLAVTRPLSIAIDTTVVQICKSALKKANDNA